MIRSVRKAFLAGAVALAASGSGPVARAMFEPGPTAGQPAPLGALASLDNRWVFMLDEEGCELCPADSARATCAHRGAPVLRYFRRVPDGEGIEGPVCQLCRRDLPGSAWGLKPGPACTLVVADRQAGFTRFHLSAKGNTWKIARTEAILGPTLRHALGLPETTCHSFAVTPDGRLVLGYERSVALLPPALEKAPRGSVTWLLGRAPSPVESKSAPTAGLSVAVGPDGKVLVVDPVLRLVYRIDPDSLAKQLIVGKEGWPTREFLPLEAGLAEDRLVVAGKPDPRAGTRRLVVLTPQPGGGLHAAKDLGVSLAAGVTFTVTPDGHLILWDGQAREALFRANRKAQEAAARREARASAAADAALKELVRAEERLEERKRRVTAAKETKAKGLARLPPAETGAGEPVEPGPAPAHDAVAALRAFAAGTRFRNAFASWVRDQEAEAPGDGPALPGGSSLMDPHCPGIPAGTVPAGLGRFALDAATLERAVRWMLEHADQANDPMGLEGWRRNSQTASPFTFRLAESRRHRGLVLEIDELEAFARAMDGGGPGPVAAALRASGGRTGLHAARDGRVRFAFGLRVALEEGLAGLRGIRPAGAQSEEHWDAGEDPIPAASPACTAASSCR